MADISHSFGGDLALSPSGDLQVAPTPAIVTQQRVLRRLLSPLGSYVWHPEYGAGLPAMVGEPAQEQRIRGTIFAQMALEEGVGAEPAPSVDVTVTTNGIVTAIVRYADQNGDTQTFKVSP